MKTIRLYCGLKALKAKVDDTDYPWLSVFRWHSCHGYPATRVGGKKLKMHQMLLPATLGLMVDHINWDKLDNRRANLRLVNKSENNRNKPPMRNNTTGVTGVVESRCGRWIAQASLNNRNYYIGSYATLQEAAAARVDFLDRWRRDPSSIPPKGPLHRNNRSGVRGIYIGKGRKGNRIWKVQVTVNCVKQHLGTFHSLEEAKQRLNQHHATCSKPVSR